MYWLFFLLFGAVCGFWGYFYGRRWSLRQENRGHLTLENNQLKHEIDALKNSQSMMAASTSDSSISTSPRSVSPNATSSSSTSHGEGSSEAIVPATSPTMTDEEVIAHPLYLSLSERHSALKTQLNEAQAATSRGEAQPEEEAYASEQHISEQSVRQHAVYRQLHEQYLELQMSNANVADDDYQAQQSAVIEELQQENERLSLALENCEENVAALRHRQPTPAETALTEHDRERGDEKDSKTSNEAAHFNADAAKAAFGKRIKQDDLTVILGIGPKIAELFKADGIDTWAKLGDTSIEHCQQVLVQAGERFKLHDPSTWPQQAKLAAEGDWHALFDWQDKLNKGREVK